METVRISVSVKQQNLDALKSLVAKVSTPGSPEYKNYLTAEQVNAMTAPRQSDIDSVVAWLSTAGVTTVEKNGVVRLETSVKQAEDLFSTKFSTLEEVYGTRRTTRAGSYSLPDNIDAAVDAIYGLHGLPLPLKQSQEEAPGMPPAVTPKVLATTYGIKGVTPAKNARNRMAVAEFQGQFMNQSDLKEFFKINFPDAPASYSEVYAFHGEKQNGDGIEAQLDIQFIMGVAPGVKAEFYEQANMDFCADLKNWTTLLLATDDVPWVHSVSYGWQGNLTQIGCKPEEVTDVDADFAKLAARGVSIIFASGDSGSGFAPPQPPMPPQCDRTEPGLDGEEFIGDVLRVLRVGVPKNAPKEEGPWICCQIAGEIGTSEGYAGWTYKEGTCNAQECMANCTVLKTVTSSMKKVGYSSGHAKKPPPAPPAPKKAPLWPSWPASSPFVTAVGATRFYRDMVDGGVEAAVSNEDHFGSGGGFSPWTFLKQGEWQAKAVEHYFNTVPASSLPAESCSYDKMGRATPDVSALGTGYAVINNGKPFPGGVGGTSASAPVFAGMVALINDVLIQAGDKPMGLLNPFIYMNEDAFKDVTIGWDRVGRGGGLLECGFNCTQGWDPVTGVGTPIFEKVLAAATKKL